MAAEQPHSSGLTPIPGLGASPGEDHYPSSAGLPGPHEVPRGKALAALCLGTLGIVYGDIGTSPLYAFREAFTGHSALPVSAENILGVLSLITWSLVLIVSIKYLSFVLRADNHGEGGILALMALVQKVGGLGPHAKAAVAMMGIFGAALLYGDGILTPAISVLSAAEGLAIYEPRFASWVVPITLVILAALFLVQRTGTGSVGKIFGPITLVWFLTIGVLGARAVFAYPAVLAALNPAHAVYFFIHNRFHGFVALGAIFLVVTGAEALYADMGHFGRRPIRITWFALVFPALLLCYFGQGALMLHEPGAITNPFFRLAPNWAILPLVVLAALAACIASQAVISGTFSLTRQALQLGYFPRLEIIHTSKTQIGQIYIPVINWMLAGAVAFLVVTFRTSGSLAGAYGIAVSSTMVITTGLTILVARDIWHWKLWSLLLGGVVFLAIDFSYLLANMLKIGEGGWLPLLLASGVMLLLTTWRSGRKLLGERHLEGILPVTTFLEGLREGTQPATVTGTAVFMTGNPEGVPPALLHNVKHNKVLHERNVLLTIQSEPVPHVPREHRLTIEELPKGFYRVVARFGFMETPKFSTLIQMLRSKGMVLAINDTSYFLGREVLIASKRKGMSRWRKALFGWMARNARSATAFFNLPPNRVVEMGAQVEL